jgi:L-asparagine transporter-like permease
MHSYNRAFSKLIPAGVVGVGLFIYLQYVKAHGTRQLDYWILYTIAAVVVAGLIWLWGYLLLAKFRKKEEGYAPPRPAYSPFEGRIFARALKILMLLGFAYATLALMAFGEKHVLTFLIGFISFVVLMIISFIEQRRHWKELKEWRASRTIVGRQE